MPDFLRRIPAPIVTTVLVLLATVMVAFWGRQDGDIGDGLRTATFRNVRAELADGGCLFTANVRLHTAWEQWALQRVRLDARQAFVTLLRNKRRYMIDNAVAREALASEMTYAVNRLAQASIADHVDFPSFQIF